MLRARCYMRLSKRDWSLYLLLQGRVTLPDSPAGRFRVIKSTCAKAMGHCSDQPLFHSTLRYSHPHGDLLVRVAVDASHDKDRSGAWGQSAKRCFQRRNPLLVIDLSFGRRGIDWDVLDFVDGCLPVAAELLLSEMVKRQILGRPEQKRPR